MKWLDDIMEMNFDNLLGGWMLNGRRHTRILTYALDNVYERLRYLTGARWSTRFKIHRYEGMSMEYVIKRVMEGEI